MNTKRISEAVGWQTPHYDCVNVTSHDRLARAIDWLRELNIYRGDASCIHQYTNSDGQKTREKEHE